MPRITPFRLAAVCMLALSIPLVPAAAAMGKGVPVTVRVVGTAGKVLAEKPVAAKTTTIPTSPKATCFGKGTGGSGKPVTLPGATALGALGEAVGADSVLRPLLVTDHFSFGIAICGVGGDLVKAGSESSWYLKVNHRAQSVGGDQVKLHAGDEVLWDLAPSYPYPDELALSAPAKATAGQPFTVRAFSYDEKGKRTPAAGVAVTGAAMPTGSDGRTTVTLSKPARLVATASDEITSARVPVCLGGKCPGGR
ncbi:MAG TPA: hypothetical protein VF731_06980 [Solirubrobacterales bacterium]